MIASPSCITSDPKGALMMTSTSAANSHTNYFRSQSDGIGYSYALCVLAIYSVSQKSITLTKTSTE